MCTVFIAWQSHPLYDLIVCSNRDEFKKRPSQRAHYWKDHPQVFAGRDLLEGGTWLGLAQKSKFSVVTNYRDFSLHKEAMRSRGELTVNYLTNNESPKQYLESVSQTMSNYNPFNLVVADGKQLLYLSNVEGEIKCLKPGVYGLSNHLLDTPWPKVAEGLTTLRPVIEAKPDIETIVETCFTVLDRKTPYDDDRLPHTGIPIETERKLSSVFVDFDDYGTQYQTVIIREKSGRTYFYEKSWSSAYGWHYETSELDI